MPDFTVIDGGGEKKPKKSYSDAAYHLEALLIEALRALGRGDDGRLSFAQSLISFYQSVAEAEEPLPEIVHQALSTLYDRAFAPSDRIWEDNMRSIVRGALASAAELMARDELAVARQSKRRTELISSIETYILDEEERCRDLGSNYVYDLMSRRPRLSDLRVQKRRAAEIARADKEERVAMQARRDTEDLFQISPDQVVLLDEGYLITPSRKVEQLTWAEARLRSMGFAVEISERVRSYTKALDEFTIYADPRRLGAISFAIFGSKKPRSRPRFFGNTLASFDLQDRWKHDLTTKVEAGLRKSLTARS
jgi:hypothetical protein